MKDMLSPIMDFWENCGYDKHTLWGNMYNDFSSIMRFYEKSGFKYYDPLVTKKYIDEIYLKYQKGEIRRSFYLRIRKAGDRLDEFYNTKLVIPTLELYRLSIRSVMFGRLQALKVGITFY